MMLCVLFRLKLVFQMLSVVVFYLEIVCVSLFFLIVWGFSSRSKNFSLIWRRYHYRWKAANFDLCSALMATEQRGFFTYCDTGHTFIIVASKDAWHSHLLPSVWQWNCHYLFLRLGSVRLGFQQPTFRLRDERSNPPRHRRGLCVIISLTCLMKLREERVYT